MYLTHYFAHPETLARFEAWLTYLGVKHHPIDPHDAGIPRIAIRVEPSQMDAIRMLISAVERTDPDGFPSFWEMAAQPHGHIVARETETSPEGHPPGFAVIGWHPNDSVPASDPEFRELCEAMSRKWGNS
jgi:hypothetical protein